MAKITKTTRTACGEAVHTYTAWGHETRPPSAQGSGSSSTAPTEAARSHTLLAPLHYNQGTIKNQAQCCFLCDF